MAGRGRGGRGAKTARGGAVANVSERAQEQSDAPNSAVSHKARSCPPEQADNGSGSQEVHHSCGMCGHNVGNDAIGCDRCSSWVHPTEMCSGLPNDVIRMISDLSGDAILFVCTNCRVKPSSNKGVSTRHGGSTTETNFPDELIQQLFLSVKGICSAVMELTARMDKAFKGNHMVTPPKTWPQPQTRYQSSNHDEGNHHNQDPANPVGDYRSVIREEMREMQERSKRRQSVIIKGMHVQSARDLISKFRDLSHSFAGTRVELTDVVPIANHSDLFRAKILDEDHRRLVLDRAKTLRDTDHATVFIRRDLTFAQRKEL